MGPFYEKSGHYSTPYVVAVAAGLTEDEAALLSCWAEYPDEDHRYDAIWGMLHWDLG